jgi:FMN phosphatase YigB (HAD superfamily)
MNMTKNKPTAIIFDMDETLVHITDKPWLEHETIPLPLQQLVNFLWRRYPEAPKILVVTGRPEKIRYQTEQELLKADIFYDELIMNNIKDERGTVSGPIFKGLIVKELKEKYDILFAIDDCEDARRAYYAQGIMTLSPLHP